MILIWQVFWLALLVIAFPFSQWQFDNSCKKAYSYGDSTGLTPDFPFNHWMNFI
jgi:hypothetical protein